MGESPYTPRIVAPIGLFSYKNYKITSWSDAKEEAVERVLGREIKKVEGGFKESRRGYGKGGGREG